MAKELKQDLNGTEQHPGMVFIMFLLMEEKCDMPDKNYMQSIMNKHLGETDCFAHNTESAGFAPHRYTVHFEKENKDAHPFLMVTSCSAIEKPLLDDIAMSQLWDCPDGEQILSSCKYQVVATDMMAAGLNYKERAEMLVHYAEALVEMFPSCKAIIFENSKKMLTREAIQNCTVPEEMRFIHYAVNVRFFRISGTDDMLVDTLGMNTLFMPDLQYHFHGLDPNQVVNHAYNVLSYIYDADNPLKSGDTIDGIKDGQMSQEVMWTVRYEDSLIQPLREVIDMNMGEYASGARE